MHYLECIAMLEYLHKKLHSTQRQQVPISTLDDVQQVLVQVQRKLQNNSTPEIDIRIRDAMEAVEEIRSVQGIMFLTQSMKEALVSGVSELLSTLRLKVFDYYKYNDFEPTEELIPIMRAVVTEALRKGVI